MSIDYDQLKAFVKEAMFMGGGINEPSAPRGVPHRMPAADPVRKQQDMGDPKANEMYEVALVAREATEKLVEALDEPIFDGAYEQAFKASACLRRVLISLEESGAHPMPTQRVVAPPKWQQKYVAGTAAGDYSGGAANTMAMGGGIGLEEQEGALKGFGSAVATQQQQAKGSTERGRKIASGKAYQGIDDKERAMLMQIEKILAKVADDADLNKYRSQLQTVLKNLLKLSAKDTAAATGGSQEKK